MTSNSLPVPYFPEDEKEDEDIVETSKDTNLPVPYLVPESEVQPDVSIPMIVPTEQAITPTEQAITPIEQEIDKSSLPVPYGQEDVEQVTTEGQDVFPENFLYDRVGTTETLDLIISNNQTEYAAEAEAYWNKTPLLQEKISKEDYLNSKAIDQRIIKMFREAYINDYLDRENLTDEDMGFVGASKDEQVMTPLLQENLAAAEQMEKRRKLLESQGFSSEEEFGQYVRSTGTPAQIKAYEDVAKTDADFLKTSDTALYEILLSGFKGVHENLTSDNVQTRRATETLLEAGLNLNEVRYIIGLDSLINPATIAVGIGVDLEYSRRAWSEGRKLDAAGNMLAAFLGGVEVVAPIGKAAKAIKKATTRITRSDTGLPVYDQSRFARDRQEKIRTEKEASVHAKANLNIEKGLGEDVIKAFEDRMGVSISTTETLPNGKTRLVIDKNKVSNAGLLKAKEMSLIKIDEAGELTDSSKGMRFAIDSSEESLTAPIVTAKSLEGLIGLLSDFEKLYPEQIGKRKTVIDDMLHLVLSKDLKPDKIMDMLDANNLNFEEFVLATYGSASEAGRILQKFGTIKKQKPTSIVNDIDSRIAIAREKGFKDFWKRWIIRPESIRRGLLVAPIAVAARNLQSVIVRNPVEGLSNFLSNVMLETQRGGLNNGLKSIVNLRASNAAWRGSMDGTKNLLSNNAKDFSQYILSEYPELHNMMYNNLHELQKGLGRGEATSIVGKNLDEMFSMLEDFSNVVNTPNRIQEHAVRTATFYGELNRLVKREWGIDNFQEQLEAGKLADFMNDTSKVRPKDGRSFNSLLADSVDKALKVTYSGQPENYILRKGAELITKSGIGTVFIPFPRFIASGLEFFGELAIGSTGPLARKARNLFGGGVKGKVTPREFDKISKNMVGVGLLLGYTKYHSSDNPDRPEDFSKLPVPIADTDINILGTYPLAQMNWIGRATNEFVDGTLGSWDGFSKFYELFLGGASIRAGASNIIVEELRSLGESVDAADPISSKKRDAAFAKMFGQWMTSWGSVLFQVVDLERGLGDRTTTRKEVAPEFTLEGDLSQMQVQTRRSARQRGALMSAEEEGALPDRQTVTDTEEERTGGLLKLVAGIDLKEVNEDVRYLHSIGFDEVNFSLGSRHKLRSVRNEQNEKMSQYLPTVIRQAKREAKIAEAKWKKSSGLQKKSTLQEYLRLIQKSSIKKGLRRYLDSIRSATEKKALIRNPLAYYTYQYSKIPEEQRKKAEFKFAEKFPNTELDLGNRKHINLLITFGKMVK